jgi:hypothetical protein
VLAGVFALAALALGAAPAAAVPNFAASREIFPYGAGISAMTLTDLDGDGIRDLVVVSGEGSVSMTRGDGHGGWGLGGSIGTGQNGTSSLAAADLDGDDRPDLVLGNAASQSLSVALNDGLGFFGWPTQIPVPGSPHDVVAGDVDGNGTTDVAYTASIGDTLTLLLGDGHGGLGAPLSYPAGQAAAHPRLVNLNGDDRLDVVVTNAPADTVSVLFGQEGDALLSAPTAFGVGDGPWDVTVLDVNGDDHPDLASANQNGHDVSVLVGDGAGGFGLSDTEPLGDQPDQLVVADFDGDGFDDLAFAVGQWIQLALADGVGGIDAGDVLFAPDDEPLGETLIVAGELNDDGDPDLVVSSKHVNALLGDPLFIDPWQLEFADQQAGGVGAPLEAAVTNVDDAPVAIGSIGLGGVDPAQFEIVGGDCAARELAPGESCTVRARFAPQAAGSFAATLLLDSDATVSPHELWLFGFAPPDPPTPAHVVATPASLSFGSVDPGRPRTLSVGFSNVGEESALLGDAVVTGAGFSIAADSCSGDYLDAGGGCAVTIRFNPRAAGAAYEGALTVPSDAGAVSVSLAGVGRGRVTFPLPVVPLTLTLSKRLVTTRSPTATLTVTSLVGALPEPRLTLSGPDAAAFAVEGDTCAGKTLTRRGRCAFTVRFHDSRLGLHRAIATASTARGSSAVMIEATGTRSRAALTGMLGRQLGRALRDWRQAGLGSALRHGMKVGGLGEAGRVRLELRVGDRRLGTTTVEVGARRAGRLVLRLTRRSKALLRATHGTRLTAILAFLPRVADGRVDVRKSLRLP